MSYTTDDRARMGLRESATFDRATIAAIHRAADTGIYDIRGWGAKRPLPHFDDLLFLGMWLRMWSSMSSAMRLLMDPRAAASL